MGNTERYPIPDDVRNDRFCRSYIHLHASNDSPLASDYCHYEREPSPDDKDGEYFGEWVDITEKDRTKARIENAKKELAKLAREKQSLEREIKQLSKELEEEE